MIRTLVALFVCLLSTTTQAADLYLYSLDGQAMAGWELQDIDHVWLKADYLSEAGRGRGFPVAHYRSNESRSGWVYDPSLSPRTVRARYRKANRITSRGRPTVVVYHAEWCGPCNAMVKAGIINQIKQVADVEQVDIDQTNPLGIASVPTLIVYDADNKEVARYVGYTAFESIKELQ